MQGPYVSFANPLYNSLCSIIYPKYRTCNSPPAACPKCGVQSSVVQGLGFRVHASEF